MISSIMMTSQELQKTIAANAKAKRLSMNFSQKTLSENSGVSYGVLKKFERTGQISLESLLKLALSLGALQAFYNLFSAANPEESSSLDELMKDSSRKRGRK